VYLASRTGFPIVPVTSAARRSWVLRSWDRFRIPQPFARVVVAYGDPIAVPPRLDDDDVEMWRLRIEAGMRALTAEADREAGVPA
jgi:lysophospholipid acyltransferase (LPLAT)-like uncharacterized protein